MTCSTWYHSSSACIFWSFSRPRPTLAFSYWFLAVDQFFDFNSVAVTVFDLTQHSTLYFMLQMYGVLSSVLHLGNVGIVLKSRRGDEAKIPDDDQHLPVVAALLGVWCCGDVGLAVLLRSLHECVHIEFSFALCFTYFMNQYLTKVYCLRC
jgi:hypothetical protein